MLLPQRICIFPQGPLVILMQVIHKSYFEETLLLSVGRLSCFRNHSHEYESLFQMIEFFETHIVSLFPLSECSLIVHATLFGCWTDLAIYP